MLMGISFFKEVKPMPLVAEDVTAAIGVPYRQKDIGVSNKRPNQKRKIKYIVIHNTANSRSTAQNEVDYFLPALTQSRRSCWIFYFLL